MTALLSTINLAFHYPRRPVVFNQLSFQLNRGDILTILGPNGIGKSTLLNCIVGGLTPTAGQLLMNNQPIDQLTIRDRAKMIAYVAQQTANQTALSVQDYVVTGRTPYLSFGQVPGVEDYERGEDALEKLGIIALKDQPLNTLSGGQQQLVTIAKALVQAAPLIILDEPTSALDFGRQQLILELIERLAADGYAIILTSHNPNHAFLLDHQVGLFAPDGHFTVGATQTLLTATALSQTYQADLKLVYVPELGRTICEMPHRLVSPN
ncbi:ABC transporter ATP-binding protein [Secundilactobacillus kimchicus]|uniref:ABC transporter ATP-binding protein n=1 Tax=Secundilactobacillus kimchicus TaxID=528209 RepID=UPI0024A9622A|nr:ABC transporter ATP-binding protein [Secundilactobacillus kimchicus]